MRDPTGRGTLARNQARPLPREKAQPRPPQAPGAGSGGIEKAYTGFMAWVMLPWVMLKICVLLIGYLILSVLVLGAMTVLVLIIGRLAATGLGISV